jgi:tetratricopeptide (TPR) repeat protein
MAKKTKELTTEQKLQNNISGFFERNLKLMLICGAALIVVVLAVVIITSSVKKAADDAMIKIQELENTALSYTSLDDEQKASLIADLEKAEQGKGYVSIKASYLKGLAYYLGEQYQESNDAFMACVSKDKDSYLAALSLVNAAACQEALGNTTSAVELYSKVSDYEISSVGAKALFNTGRIYYQQGNMELAKTVFSQLVDKYPSSEYSALATDVLVLM